jgi:hypothetical protein
MKLLTGPGCSSFHLVGLRCSNIISVVCADCARYPRGVCAMSSSAETTTSPERLLPKEFSRFRGFAVAAREVILAFSGAVFRLEVGGSRVRSNSRN